MNSPPILRTIRRSMVAMGFCWERWKENKFFDGHDRQDVLDYQQKQFIPGLDQLRPLIVEWDTKRQVAKAKRPHGEKQIVLLFQDECVFHCNDGLSYSWVFEGNHKLRPKGSRRGLHRLDFICSTTSWLKEAGKQMAIRKNFEGSWTSKDMLVEIRQAVKAFESHHDRAAYQPLFIFDHSSGHQALAEDALRSSRMNRGPGSVPARMRDGWFWQQDPLTGGKTQVKQSMQDEERVPKGMGKVLRERVFDGNSIKKLRGRCQSGHSYPESEPCCLDV